MIDPPNYLRSRFGSLHALVLILVAAVLISGCGSSLAKATSAPHGPALYTLIQGDLNSPTGPPPYSLSAYDGASGHLRFSHMLSGSASALVAAQNRLGIVSIIPPAGSTTQPSSSILLVYDASGTQTQRIALGSLIPQQVLASSDTFFVGSTSKSTGSSATSAQFIAFDATTGAQRWQHSIPDANDLDNFVLAGQDLIGNVETPSGPFLTAFDIASGAQVWQGTEGSVGGAGGSIGASGDTVYTVQSTSSADPTQQTLVAHAATTGTTRWSVPFTSPATQVQIVAADQNAVYCDVSSSSSNTASTDMLSAYAASNGHQLWSVPETSSIDSEYHGQSVLVVNGVLYITVTAQGSSTGSSLSSLIAVNVSTGSTIWSKFLTASPLTAPVVSGNGVYIGLLPNTTGGNASIAAFNATNGSPLWQNQTTAPSLGYLATLP